MTNVLLIYDHTVVRESIANTLKAEGDLAITSCSSASEAQTFLAMYGFDIAVIEYELTSGRALTFIPNARKSGFTGPILVMTSWIGEAEARRLMRQGVKGIFQKQRSAGDLAQAIRMVSAGDTWYDSYSLSSVPQATNPFRRLLSGQEKRVVAHVLEGLANKEIASRMAVSEGYVKSVLQRVFLKTGARSRVQLVRIAMDDIRQVEDAGSLTAAAR